VAAVGVLVEAAGSAVDGVDGVAAVGTGVAGVTAAPPLEVGCDAGGSVGAGLLAEGGGRNRSGSR
jgi:hypothetical protein